MSDHHDPKQKIRTLQPHSGAIALVLYHYLKDPKKKSFVIRVDKPEEKVYEAAVEGQTSDYIKIRTGRDWACYSNVRHGANFTEFNVDHSRTSRNESFRIYGDQLRFGEVTTEAGLKVTFEGEFRTPEKLELEEHYRHPITGQPIYRKRQYEIEQAN